MSDLTISVDNYYNIYLSKTFGGTVSNFHIIGITNINTVTANDDQFNIFQTYFEPVGLGLTSYTNSVSSTTPIYICNPVTSLEPLTIDTDTKLFIPDSIIDKDKSEELVPVSLFNFNISNIYKRYTDNEDRDTYIKEVMPKIQSALKTLIDFSVTELDLKQVNEVVYMRNDDISSIEQDKQVLYDKLYASKLLETQQSTNKDSLYNNSLSVLLQTIKEYENLVEETKTLNNRLFALLG